MVKFLSEYNNLFTISFSALSFVVACIALFFSARSAIRDRGELLITARVVKDSVCCNIYKIEVTVINVGRRVASIEGVLRHYDNGCKYYEEIDGGFLREKDRVFVDVEERHLIINDNAGEAYRLKDITVLDIEGVEHKINNSKGLVNRFFDEF